MKFRHPARKGSNKPDALPRKSSDLMAKLEEIESREKIRLKVALPANSFEQAAQFLKEKGFQWRDGIVLLISYGLSDETQE